MELASKAPGINKIILIVDDDKTILDLYQASLARQGFKIATAESGDKAIALFKAGHEFDLVVTDLMMPGKGGFELLKEMQEAGFYATPVIVVTARALDQSTFQTINLESNVKGVLQKPINMKEFHKKIHQLLGTTPPKTFNEWVD